MRLYVFICTLACVCVAHAHAEDLYRWKGPFLRDIVLEKRIHPPTGYTRLVLDTHSFGDWLRYLPLLPDHHPVLLHSGNRKNNQGVHHAVIDIDVGSRDLQQCADAVIRLRSEYLYALNRNDLIEFHFTSGDLASYTRWINGERPVIDGNRVVWEQKAGKDSGYNNFRNYLTTVFIYAGSASLEKELKKVENPQNPLPGDVFIQGGFPGHAVIVLDVAVNSNGKNMMLLAQSYMPAQQIHILKNLFSENTPWYPAKKDGKLVTPEWIFNYTDLKRF